MNYAILDIEATGGKAGTEKIIDIYIYKFDGNKILDQFGSMVNPQRSIDAYVQKLTGITEKMVKGAPKFYELAKRVIEITENCVIVGHGVDFDYRMLRQEFRELGYDFQRQTLDTLSLSQKLIPDADSHSLGKLGKSLGIPINSRHTAEGDTRLTLELFKLLLERDKGKNVLQSFAIQDPKNKKHISKLIELEKELPNETGIFYFLNASKKVIFLAASKNIKSDVNDIFTSNNKNHLRIQSQVQHIEFELTGSFLIAILKEIEEKKIHKNLLQANQKNLSFGLFASKENETFEIEKTYMHRKQPLLLFSSKKRGFRILKKLITELDLNSKMSFNQKIKKINAFLNYHSKNLILIDKGRTKNEKSFIEITNNQLIGYGFYTFYNQIENEEIRKNLLIDLANSAKAKAVIKTFIKFYPLQHIIPFNENQSIKIPKKHDRKRSKTK